MFHAAVRKEVAKGERETIKQSAMCSSIEFNSTTLTLNTFSSSSFADALLAVNPYCQWLSFDRAAAGWRRAYEVEDTSAQGQ